MKKDPSLGLPILTAAALLASTVLSHAAELHWTGGTDNNFTNEQNWNDGLDGTYPGLDPADVAIIDAASSSIFINSDLTFRTLNLINGNLQLSAGKTATIFNSNFAGGTLTLDAGAIWALAESITAGEPPVTTAPFTLFNGGSLKLNGGTSSAKTKFAAPITSYRDLSAVPPGVTNPTWGDGARYIKAGSLSFNGGYSEISGQVNFAGDVTMSDANVASTYNGEFNLHAGTLTLTGSTFEHAKNIKIFTTNGASTGNVLSLTDSKIIAGDRLYVGADGAETAVTLHNSSLTSEQWMFIGYGAKLTLEMTGNSSIIKKNAATDAMMFGNGAGADVEVNVRGDSFIAGNREIYIGSKDGSIAAGSEATVNLHDNAKLGNFGGITNAQLRVGTAGSTKEVKGFNVTDVTNKGTLNAYAGTTVDVVNAEIGYSYGTGTVTLTNATFKTTGGNLTLGLDGGNGTFIATDSVITISGELQVGRMQNFGDPLDTTSAARAGSNAHMELHGNTTVTAGGNSHIAISGQTFNPNGNPVTLQSEGYMELNDTSSFTQTGGSTFNIGYRTSGKGTLVLRDDAQFSTFSEMNLGMDGGTGILTISDSADLIIKGDFSVGRNGNNTASGTITMTGGTIDVQKNMEVARGGTGGVSGSITMSGTSMITVGGRLLLSSGGAGRSSLTMSDNTVINANGQDFMMGYSGTAAQVSVTLNDNATINAAGVFSVNNGGSGTVLTLNDNSRINANIFRFQDGDGVSAIINDSARITTTNGAYMGYNVSRSLTIGGTDAQFIVGTEFQISDGNQSDATKTININTGGLLDVGTTLRIGSYTTNTINFTVNGGTVQAGNIVFSNHFSSGEKHHFNVINGGSVTTTGDMVLAQQGTAGAVATVSGTSSVNVGAALIVGHNTAAQTYNTNGETGEVTVNGDSAPAYTHGTYNIGTDGSTTDLTTVIADAVILGSQNARGTVNLYGSSSLKATTSFIVGRDGNGVLNINDTATAKTSGDLYIGGSPTANAFYTLGTSGTVTLNGGTLDVRDGKIRIANTYSTTIPDDPATTEVNEAAYQEQTGTGSLSVKGGTVITQGIVKGDGAATVTVNGGTLQATAANDNFFENFAANEVIIGESGAVFNIGTNNVGIQGGFTGTGDITVNGTGTLALEGDLSGWTGAIAASAGNVEIASGTVLKFVLDGTKTGTGLPVDAENAYAGAANIIFDGSVTLHIALANPQDITQDGTYIFNVFTGANVPSGNVTIVGTTDATFQYAYIGNGQVQLTVTGIPEPSTYALLGGVVLLAGAALRRRKTRA